MFIVEVIIRMLLLYHFFTKKKHQSVQSFVVTTVIRQCKQQPKISNNNKQHILQKHQQQQLTTLPFIHQGSVLRLRHSYRYYNSYYSTQLQYTKGMTFTTGSSIISSSSIQYQQTHLYSTTNKQTTEEDTVTETEVMSSNNSDTTTSNNNDDKKIKTAIITTNIQECGIRIQQGKLVAFPTETVYGLGANALDEQAVLSIFKAKERPLTDPLIVHVLYPSDAYRLWQATSSTTTATTTNATTETTTTTIDIEKAIIQSLCTKFWPGPLTIVAKATKHIVPDVIMAGTGYCACRSPSNTIARQLLQATIDDNNNSNDGAIIPIAAPSANKFGHVSPTSYQHVYDDLQFEDVWILKESEQQEEELATTTTNSDNQKTTTTSTSTSSCCEVGVESSVVKVEQRQQQQMDNDNKQTIQYIVTMLRQGSISINDIQQCLTDAGLYSIDSNIVSITTMTKRATTEDVSNIAPGQLIRHYSPNIPSFMLSCNSIVSIEKNMIVSKEILNLLQYTIIIDYGQRLQSLQKYSLNYYDLSYNNNSIEGAQNIFKSLRWAEQISNARVIIFPQIIVDDENYATTTTEDNDNDDALTLAIHDKLKRAASGVIVDSIEQIDSILKEANKTK